MSDDSEVDSDEAFDSADERQFGGAFGGDEGEEESDGGAISSLFSSIQDGARGGSDEEVVEEDSEEGDDHEQLLSSVVGGAHSTRASQRAAVARAATAFSHSGSGASGVTINSLVDSLQGQAAHGALQARFDSMGEGGAALSAPIAPIIRRRAERAVAYDSTTSHVTRWEPLVQENRQAPVLRMTAQDAKRPVASLASLASKYTPESAMEKEIAALLESSGMATAKQVAASEKAEIEALAAQRGDALAARRAKGGKGAKGAAAAAEARAKREAKRGRDELQQLRSLMFYEEVKAKRSKKIKSRAYRKIAKKQREKIKELEREQLRALDPDAARKQDEADELERARMRMDLTHSNLSKRSKRALRQHGGGNDAQRSALMDELKEREKLHRRMNRLGSSRENEAGVSDSDASDGEDAEADGGASLTPLEAAKAHLAGIDADIAAGASAAALAAAGTKSTLGGLQFVQNALARQQQSARAEALQTVRDLSAEAGGAEAAAAAANALSATTSASAGRRVFGGSSARAPPQSASADAAAMAAQLHKGEQSALVRHFLSPLEARGVSLPFVRVPATGAPPPPLPASSSPLTHRYILLLPHCWRGSAAQTRRALCG